MQMMQLGYVEIRSVSRVRSKVVPGGVIGPIDQYEVFNKLTIVIHVLIYNITMLQVLYSV